MKRVEDVSMSNARFCAWFREHRNEWPRQADFAAYLGVTQQAVSKYLSGVMKPSVAFVRRLLWIYPRDRQELLDAVFPPIAREEEA